MKIKKVTRITYIWQRVLMAVVFVVGLLGVILNDDQSVKSEYLFVCAQSVMFLIVSFLPNFLRKFELDIPDFIYIIFIFFCLAHFFCGEILGFFVKIKWWDSVLHTFSGMIIALLSFSLINLLNKNSNGFKLNIVFAAIFAFSLTITIGVLWEIIEFTTDSCFGTNMQRAYVSTMNGRGVALVGQSALADTMKDLILDSIGAAVVCVICVIAVCMKKIDVEDLSFIKKKKKVVMMNAEDVGNLDMKASKSKVVIDTENSDETSNVEVEQSDVDTENNLHEKNNDLIENPNGFIKNKSNLIKNRKTAKAKK